MTAVVMTMSPSWAGLRYPRRRGCKPRPDRMRFAQVSLGRRGHPWRGTGVWHAARYFGRVHRSRIKCTAALRPVSVRVGDAGSRPSVAMMPTTARTRPAPSARGRNAIATTGASTDARTRNSARAIAKQHGGGEATDARRGLQRWTRQRRFHQCLRALTGSFRQVPRSLQRWTRGLWK